MNKIKDFFYNKNDVILALLILVVAAVVIYYRIHLIMEYPATQASALVPMVKSAVLTALGVS